MILSISLTHTDELENSVDPDRVHFGVFSQWSSLFI